jgi:hypothetical protein
VIELAQAVEATALAEALRRSRWVYPLVNAGHILGLGLLVGAVIPMDWAVLRRRVEPALRPFAVFGFGLAAGCGGLLFAAQATEYAANSWFRIKLVLLILALTNAAFFLGLDRGREGLRRATAFASLLLWPAVLVCGRMVAYS